jgi:hypothetical protein
LKDGKKLLYQRCAAAEGHLEIVKMLIEHGIEIDVADE